MAKKSDNTRHEGCSRARSVSRRKAFVESESESWHAWRGGKTFAKTLQPRSQIMFQRDLHKIRDLEPDLTFLKSPAYYECILRFESLLTSSGLRMRRRLLASSPLGESNIYKESAGNYGKDIYCIC